MLIREVRLQNFRNIGFAALEFAGPRQFLVGANGQGKTALLEAVGLLTAARSFRTTDGGAMIAHGAATAAAVYSVDHDTRGPTSVSIGLSRGSKEISVDEERISRLGDFLGLFPSVVFSSQDRQLLRGSPSARRRWLDLVLAATSPAYLESLQAYHRALASRNALLRRNAPAGELDAFEQPLARQGARLVSARAEGLAELAGDLAAAYARIADRAEESGFAYEPDQAGADEATLRARLAAGRERDLRSATTGAGPHRDDFVFTLGGHPARDFASEGQERSLVLALRIAQAAHARRRTGLRPVLLADDVLGELDPERRRRFWSTVDEDLQVVATGTEVPRDGDRGWQVFSVRAGEFAAEASR